MSQRPNWVPFGAVLVALGCALPREQSTATGSATLGTSLRGEGQAILEFWGTPQLLGLFLLVLAAVVVARGVAFGIYVLWRLGFDSQRQLGRWIGITHLLLGLLVLYAVVQRAASVAPTVTAVSALLLTCTVLLAARDQVQNLTVGIALVLRRSIRPGDRLQLGELSGTVREIGLLRIRLRHLDGNTTLVPNRVLNKHPITVDPARSTVPVQVVLRTQRAPSSDFMEQLRRIALLSPYRSPGSPVLVSRLEGPAQGASIRIRVLAASVARAAQSQLEAALENAEDLGAEPESYSLAPVQPRGQEAPIPPSVS